MTYPEDNLIIGNSPDEFELGDIVEASYKGMKCNVKIVRTSSKEEYLSYLNRMNFTPERFHGPHYYAGVAD